MKKLYTLLLLISISSVKSQNTFNWESFNCIPMGCPSSTTSLSETINGVTAFVSTNCNFIAVEDFGTYLGTNGNVMEAGGTGCTNVTVTFSSPIDITAIGTARHLGDNGVVTLTPIPAGGNNTPVTFTETSNNLVVSNMSWQNVTSFLYSSTTNGITLLDNIVWTASLSANDFTLINKLKLYPNPAQNQVTIEANELTNASLQIMDINGRVLQIQNLQNTNTINIENFQTGVYLFKITSQEGTITQRVVKN